MKRFNRGESASGHQPFKFNGLVAQRYGVEIAGIFAIKLPLLVLLWLVAIHPWPHDPAAAATSVARIYTTSAHATSHD